MSGTGRNPNHLMSRFGRRLAYYNLTGRGDDCRRFANHNHVSGMATSPNCTSQCRQNQKVDYLSFHDCVFLFPFFALFQPN
jgi:hypothetical protein